MIPSYHLLKGLMSEHPTAKVQMIIGSDLVPTLDNWVEAEKLQAECFFFVIPRPGFPVPALHSDHFTVMPEGEYCPMPQSSTAVRTLLGEAASDSQLLAHLPAPVVTYIRSHSLYT